MVLRKCPVCGTAVKLENLERHVANVHPGRRPSLNLTVEDQVAIRRQRRRARAGFEIKRSTVIVVVSLALLLVGVVAAWSYMPWSGTGGPGMGGGMVLHIHPNLVISIDGQQVTVPSQIGIDPLLWVDHSLDEYGMSGMAPLRTHNASGDIHVESRVMRAYSLGEFFRIGGRTFDGREVLGHQAQPGHAVWMVVDGQRMAPTDSLVLKDGMQIQVVCGLT